MINIREAAIIGEYGLTDLCISVPTIVSAKGAGLPFDNPLPFLLK